MATYGINGFGRIGRNVLRAMEQSDVERIAAINDLTSWLDTNLTHPPANGPISWGNSLQAVRLADGRRVALTPHHVVILELHPSPLDLETQMSSRLATWKFSY